jgi:hypothetical protein
MRKMIWKERERLLARFVAAKMLWPALLGSMATMASTAARTPMEVLMTACAPDSRAQWAMENAPM